MIGVYLRVSTSKQDTAAQRHAIERWIEKQAYPKAKIIYYEDDGISGSTNARPDYQRLLRDAESGKINRIIVYELSRLSRNFMETLRLMERLTELKVAVETPSDGVLKFDGSMQQFLIAAKGLVASQERDLLRARTKEGIANARKRLGRWGAPNGNSNKTGKLKEYPPELVKRILRLSSKLTTSEIAVEVNLSQPTVWRILKRFG